MFTTWKVNQFNIYACSNGQKYQFPNKFTTAPFYRKLVTKKKMADGVSSMSSKSYENVHVSFLKEDGSVETVSNEIPFKIEISQEKTNTVISILNGEFSCCVDLIVPDNNDLAIDLYRKQVRSTSHIFIGFLPS